MKITIASFIFLLWEFTLLGQTPDTTFVSVSQENARLEKQQLMDAYDQAFSVLEPSRWLFALNLSALSSNQNSLVRGSAEVKLLPAISLHGSYGFGRGQPPSSSSVSLRNSLVNHRFGLETRWYYAMPRGIRQGKSANNMSGNYIGLEAAYALAKFDARTFGDEAILVGRHSLALRYGLQRRLFRYGFLDIGFGLGLSKEQRSAWQSSSNDGWDLFANSQIGLGLALARPTTTASAGGYCDVLRCFREEWQMWKIDLYNLFRVNNSDDYKGQLSVAYERKIGTSPFSLEVKGEWSQQHTYSAYKETNPSEITGNSSAYGGALQPRYYYSQKRRLAKGRSGNNLSGVYLGGQLHWLQESRRLTGYQCGYAGCFPFDAHITDQTTGVSLLWGIQHRLFQHGFIDFQFLGTQAWTQSRALYFDYLRTTASQAFHPAVNLRAGLAF